MRNPLKSEHTVIPAPPPGTPMPPSKTIDELTLSQLIDRCGDRFSALFQLVHIDKWHAMATPLDEDDMFFEAYGDTPEHAVRKLIRTTRL